MGILIAGRVLIRLESTRFEANKFSESTRLRKFKAFIRYFTLNFRSLLDSENFKNF